MDNPEDSSIRNKVKVADAKLSVDFHRCGKCFIEYESLEEFICHKVGVHKCTLVLWESKKLLGVGLQIPSFIEFSEEETSNTRNEMERKSNYNRMNKMDICRRRRGRPRKNEDKIIINNVGDATKSESSICCLSRATFKSLNALKLHAEAEHEGENAVSETVRASGHGNLKQIKRYEIPTTVTNDLGITKFVTENYNTKDELYKESTCPKCGNIYKDPIVLKTHLNTVHCDNRPYMCKYDCPLSFKTKGSLMRHMRRHTGERPYICKKCGRSFRESGALTRHLKSRFSCSTKTDNDLGRYGKTVKLNKSESAKEKSQSALPKSTLPVKILITDILKKSLTSLDQLVNSSSSSNESIVVIEEDNNEIHGQNMEGSLEIIHDTQDISYGSTTKDSSVDNICKEKKIGTKSYKYRDACITENCEAEFETLPGSSSKPLEDLLIEDEELKCLSCKQNFLRKLDFKNHLLFHLEGLPFRCIHCCYVCQSKQDLISHQRKKHGVFLEDALKKKSELDENYQQEISESGEEDESIQDIVKLLFRIQNSIEADELEFSGLIKKPAKHSNRCHICLKRFSGSLYLSCHMGSHTGEKPFVCDVCKKGFFLKDSLKKHSVCHSEERRYRCGECYKPFKRLSHVRDHLRIHSQLCPYQCTKCGKSFRWQASLKSHESSHDGPSLKLHHCTICGRRFPSKWSLSRHQRSHSSETANTAQHLTLQGNHESICAEERGNKTLKCLSESKIVCISDDELLLRKEGDINIGEQDSAVSGAGDETYVFITQEDGSSCLVPTVAIVEELQEGASAMTNIGSCCS